uniref:Uncharacterized protein n=1 Tax=Triticum urartu TaxID=4572 RepID=A0A8R7U7T6_TRIUA
MIFLGTREFLWMKLIWFLLVAFQLWLIQNYVGCMDSGKVTAFFILVDTFCQGNGEGIILLLSLNLINVSCKDVALSNVLNTSFVTNMEYRAVRFLSFELNFLYICH